MTLRPGGLRILEKMAAGQPGQGDLLHFADRQRAGDEGEIERQADQRRAEHEDGVAEEIEDGRAFDHGQTS
jgi:hypothetical protein